MTEQDGSPDDLITVCDKCLQASCWQGIFMCDQSIGTNAGTVQRARKYLQELDLENPSYWLTDEQLAAR